MSIHDLAGMWEAHSNPIKQTKGPVRMWQVKGPAEGESPLGKIITCRHSDHGGSSTVVGKDSPNICGQAKRSFHPNG